MDYFFYRVYSFYESKRDYGPSGSAKVVLSGLISSFVFDIVIISSYFIPINSYNIIYVLIIYVSFIVFNFIRYDNLKIDSLKNTFQNEDKLTKRRNGIILVLILIIIVFFPMCIGLLRHNFHLNV